MTLKPPPPDTTSFDALYRDTATDLFAYVATIVGDRASAEDVTMAAYERAYRHRDRFDRRRGSERAWLFGIARNAALDELRRRRRVAPALGELEAVATRDRDADGRAAVSAALAALDARERELVALKFFAGLSHGEIAAVLGTTAGNAGTKLHRVRVKLREACNAPS